MLTIHDRAFQHDCQGYSRRDFLKIGSLGLLGGLGLPQLLGAKAAAAEAPRLVKDRAVVLLFLQGGPSHIETFDPKMNAMPEVRSFNGDIQTSLPGYTFGSTFPRLAKLADQIAVVRNYGSRNNDHSYLAVTSGGNPLKASMSSLYARVTGPVHPQTGLPTNVLVLPEAVQPGLKQGSNFETGALPTLTSPGELGPNFGAFDPASGGELKKLLNLSIARDRFDDRRLLLGQLDALRRRVDDSRALDGMGQLQQKAFDLIVRGVVEAFDVTREDPKTVARYDTSKLFRIEEVTRWYDMKRASNLLGKQMLLARRLVEAGCGFVTVSDCGWDMHANENSPKNMGAFPQLGGQVDHAVSAFIEDVTARGLSDRILLIVTGEMGRSPRRNRNGGRDHYGTLTPLLLFGGGLRMGQVIGQSDKGATAPAGDPQTPANLLATVSRAVFDLTEVRANQATLGRTADVLTASEPIPGLFPV